MSRFSKKNKKNADLFNEVKKELKEQKLRIEAVGKVKLMLIIN